ncbi:MAG: insulinase family protein [Actinobacteria bacterium]|nr:insulinase family protein [Actinomycetota bacterium]
MRNNSVRAGRRAWIALALVIAACTSDSQVTVDSAVQTPATFDPATPLTESTDPVAFDPEVRTGTLDNGLTYFIRRSDRPGNKAELRLAINAGSALEADDQSAVAHFLEHMLFNGTEKYEKNDLVEVLRQGGVEFGADINAYTSYDETVYQLTVDSDDEELTLGMDILHEWLTAATLTEADVIGERGVVLDEYRTRELTADGRVFTALESLYLSDTAYAGRSPIGSSDAIADMVPGPLRRFYDSWYRPANAAVIVVGDIDVDEIETRIADLFGNDEPRAEAPEPLELVWNASEQPRAAVITDADLTEAGIELSLPKQATPRDTVGAQAAGLIDYIVTAALANRLESDITSGAAPFDGAFSSTSSFVRALDAPSVYLTASNEEAGAATEALLDEYARAVQFGLSDADVERVIAETRTGVESAYAQRDTVQASELADGLVAHFLQGESMASAQAEYDLSTALLDAMDAAIVNAVLREQVSRTPAVLAVSVKEGTAGLPSVDELVSELAALDTRQVTPRADTAPVGDQLMDAPDPAEIVNREEIEGEPGAYIAPTMVEFANGVRVIVNPTPITDDFIVLYGVSAGGFSLTDPDDAATMWLMNEVNSESGFGSLSRDAVAQILAASTVDIFPYPAATSEFIAGTTATDDLELAFQLVNRYLSASNFSQVALDDARERNLTYLVDIAADPALAVQLELNDARYGDDPRYRVVLSEQELSGITTADLARVWSDRFGNAGDFVFILSGDLDLEETIDLAARYLGTLPSTGVTETAVDVSPAVPAGIVRRTVLAGSGETASLSVLYTTPAEDTTEQALLAGLLTSVLNNRLTTAIREELGASYSPAAAVSISSGPAPEATAAISISGAPSDMPAIALALQANIDDLRVNGPSAAEFSAAVAEASDAYNFISDNQIVVMLERWLSHPQYLEDYGNQPADIRGITADDLRAFANKVLPTDHYIEITQLPR